MNKKVFIGKKLGMIQVLNEDGSIQGGTVIQSDGCTVTEVRTVEKDGYNALQLGFAQKKEGRANKAELGNAKKNNVPVFSLLKEFRLEQIVEGVGVGDVLKVDQYQVGDTVSVRSRSVGRGFAGAIKRWNHRRGPMSHGSKNHRLMGSIGAGTTPGRVLLGQKMPGRMGNAWRTIKNLKVLRVDVDKGLLILSGSVPGKKNNTVYITKGEV